jgi:hypothetical protein
VTFWPRAPHGLAATTSLGPADGAQSVGTADLLWIVLGLQKWLTASIETRSGTVPDPTEVSAGLDGDYCVWVWPACVETARCVTIQAVLMRLAAAAA